jgi:hypothetical protein
MNFVFWTILVIMAIVETLTVFIVKNIQAREEEHHNTVNALERDVTFLKNEARKQAQFFVDQRTRQDAEIDSLRDKVLELIKINREISHRYVLYKETADQIAARVKKELETDANQIQKEPVSDK